ncbi:hypothetical protein U9M48_035094 [Paspalum notatum var. saurae]|uniref:Uncharacterized protein n=1 Tax=Paspalum notatum var. saurae TaxID=547442 RepID=A0AAQ3UAK0_PASNO
METTTLASKTGAVEEPRHLCNVAPPAERLADQQECNHFSLRGYVALLQKKDPKLRSLQIYGDQQQYDEHHNSSPLSVAKYRRISSGFQGSPNNLDVSANILNDVSMDVSDLPDVAQMISSVEANDTESPCSPKPCVVVNEEQNMTTQDIPNNDPNDYTRNRHKDSKHISEHRSNLIQKQGPCRASLRSVRSDSKRKNNKSSGLDDIPYIKFYQRKTKKMRLLSELINTDQVGGSEDAIEVDYENNVDINESGKSRVSLEVGKDDDTHSNQKVGEIQSKDVKNEAKHTGVDNVDDGSPLLDWLKKPHKKVRTEKKDSGHMYLGSSTVSNSNHDMAASKEMHHDFLLSVGDLDQKNVPSTIIADHGNEKAQNDNTEKNMLRPDGSPQMESQGIIHICQTKDGPIDTSTVLDSKQKALQVHGSIRTEAAYVHPLDLHKQKSSQCHADSRTKNPNSHPTESHTQNSFQVRALPIARASSNYITDQPVVAAVDHYTNEVVNHVQLRSVPSTSITMEAGRLGDQRLAGHSGLYGREPMTARYQRADKRHMELQTQTLSPQYGGHLIEKASLTPQDLSRHQKDIAKWSGNCGTQSGYRLGESKGTTSFAIYRKGNHETLNSGMSSVGCNALQLGSISPVDPELDSTSYGNHHIEKAPLMLQDLSWRQVQQNLHRSLRPHPRFGVFGPLLQQDIAKCCAASQEYPSKVMIQASLGLVAMLMCDSFKTASRNSPTSTYGFQFRNIPREVNSVPIHMYGASRNYVTHQPVVAGVDHCTNEVVNHVQLRSVPSTSLTMEVGRPLRPHPRVGARSTATAGHCKVIF